MSDASPAVQKEMDELKARFSYRNFSLDFDMLSDDLDREIFSDEHLAGRSMYSVANEFLLDCYFEKEALEPLTKLHSEQPFRAASEYERLLDQLMAAKRFDLIKHLWRTVTRLTRADFFNQLHRRQFGEDEIADEYKSYALDAYDQGKHWMDRLGFGDIAEQFEAEKKTVQDEKLPPLPEPANAGKIDDAKFWELVRASAENAVSPAEQVILLGEALQTFKAPQIKRFGSIYSKLMKKLYHWDVWALAYAARDGCSDSAFEEFRTWLILQGDPALIDCAIADPVKAAQRIPADPDLPEGSLLSVIGESYLLRAGEPFELPSIDLEKPKGKFWAEEDLKKKYPDLIKYYQP